MKTPIYFPAISTTTTGYLSKYRDSELLEKYSENVTGSFRFYNLLNDGAKGESVEPYFHHPYMLISAAHHFKQTDDVAAHLDISDDAMVFIDSGGFQLASGAIKEAKWNNEKAFKWSVKNGNVFPILDRPLIPGCSYDDHLQKSKESAEFYAEQDVAGYDPTILNVLQGRNRGELETWYDSIKDVSLDGWAHGGHKGHMKNILTAIIMMIKDGAFESSKLHHIFGVSRTDAVIYFAVIQDCIDKLGYDTDISYDSSYFQRSFGFGNYFLYKKFTGFVNIKFSNRFDYSHLTKEARLPCDCPICSPMRNVPQYFDDSNLFYLAGVMHNLWQFITYKQSIENILHMNMDDLLKDAIPSKMFKNVMVIREAFANIENGEHIVNTRFDDKEFEHSTKADLGDLI